jgi:hypothetical protein
LKSCLSCFIYFLKKVLGRWLVIWIIINLWIFWVLFINLKKNIFVFSILGFLKIILFVLIYYSFFFIQHSAIWRKVLNVIILIILKVLFIRKEFLRLRKVWLIDFMCRCVEITYSGSSFFKIIIIILLLFLYKLLFFGFLSYLNHFLILGVFILDRIRLVRI